MKMQVLADTPGDDPELILIASGSELSLAVEALEHLVAEGIRSRVVSSSSRRRNTAMPCCRLA